MVHLRVESLPCISSVAGTHGTTTSAAATEFGEILWQPEAPVHSVLYKVPAQQMVRINMSIELQKTHPSARVEYGHWLAGRGYPLALGRHSDNVYSAEIRRPLLC